MNSTFINYKDNILESDPKHYLVCEEDDTIHKTIRYTDHDAILHEYDNRFKNILAQQNTCLKSTHFVHMFPPLVFQIITEHERCKDDNDDEM